MINENRKICISTWYRSTNYGTGLQALALEKFLEDLGYSCYFLEDKRAEKRRNIPTSRRKMSISLIRIAVAKMKNKKSFEKRRKLIRKYDQEHNKVFEINTEEDVKRLNQETDIFIAGGDQIWNPYVLERKHLFTMVQDDKKMISFGTSVGVTGIPKELRKLYKTYLSRFQSISVREVQSAQALDFLQQEVTEVIDPTLLFDEKGWRFLTDRAEINKDYLSRPYILCYFIGERKTYWNYVKKIQRETGYRVLVIPVNYAGYDNKYEKMTDVTMKEFLALIQSAEIVCTDSFHATLFSIQYQKEFYVLKRFKDQSKQSQNGRLENMLGRYGLYDRLIQDERSFKRKKIRDYERSLEKIKNERERSVKWLIQALE